jgi:hypothetical protein
MVTVMDLLWASVAIIGLLYWQLHQMERQIAELRRTMDLQLAGLRHNFEDVNESLKWIEPQLKLNSFNGVWIAARHASINSIAEIRAAVEAGQYQSALIPLTDLRVAQPASIASQPSVTDPAIGSDTTRS